MLGTHGCRPNPANLSGVHCDTCRLEELEATNEAYERDMRVTRAKELEVELKTYYDIARQCAACAMRYSRDCLQCHATAVLPVWVATCDSFCAGTLTHARAHTHTRTHRAPLQTQMCAHRKNSTRSSRHAAGSGHWRPTVLAMRPTVAQLCPQRRAAVRRDGDTIVAACLPFRAARRLQRGVPGCIVPECRRRRALGTHPAGCPWGRLSSAIGSRDSAHSAEVAQLELALNDAREQLAYTVTCRLLSARHRAREGAALRCVASGRHRALRPRSVRAVHCAAAQPGSLRFSATAADDDVPRHRSRAQT